MYVCTKLWCGFGGSMHSDTIERDDISYKDDLAYYILPSPLHKESELIIPHHISQNESIFDSLRE